MGRKAVCGIGNSTGIAGPKAIAPTSMAYGPIKHWRQRGARGVTSQD